MQLKLLFSLPQQEHNLKPWKQPKSAQRDSTNVIVRGEGGRCTTLWTIRGDAGAEMTLRTVEIIIDGALSAPTLKNILVHTKEKSPLALFFFKWR